MKHIYRIEKLSGVCAAFGFFDALHRGHQSVISKLIEEAKKRALMSVLVCFADSDSVYTTEEERENILKDYALDVLISCGKEDSKNILSDAGTIVQKLGVRCIVKEESVSDTIYTAIPFDIPIDIPVVTCPPVFDNGALISSAALDGAFANRDFQKFRQLCDRPYRLFGEIVHGKSRGKTIGMPTINLDIPDHKKRPPEGVYATLTDIDGRLYKGVTNIGRRPSVDNDDVVTIETFLFDFSDDIYGKKIVLNVYAFLRPVMKFDGLIGVKRQVEKDIVSARNILPETM